MVPHWRRARAWDYKVDDFFFKDTTIKEFVSWTSIMLIPAINVVASTLTAIIYFKQHWDNSEFFKRAIFVRKDKQQ